MGCGCSAAMAAAVDIELTKENQWKAMLWNENFSDLMDAGGCDIPLTEERAISLVQLDLLITHTRRRLKRRPWSVDRPAANGKWRKCSLSLTSEVTLYDLNSNVILPSTSERRCSMVELLATAAQPPDYFVSSPLYSVLPFRCCSSAGQSLLGRASGQILSLCQTAQQR